MNKDKTKISMEKDLRVEIQQQIEGSIGKLREILGEKKFSSRVKKAAKLITNGIDKKKMKLGSKKATDKKEVDNKSEAPAVKKEKIPVVKKEKATVPTQEKKSTAPAKSNQSKKKIGQ